MAPIIYKINNAEVRDKMASFDYDWTIVNPRDGKTFPTSKDDWQWLYPEVPEKIKQYYERGFMVVVFTNQSKPWKCEQIQSVMELLDIPLFIVVAMNKCDYKPNTVLLDTLCEAKKINKEESFFVGDALGRKTDFSDSDKVFAENIGISCYSPESIFPTKNDIIELPTIPLSSNPELIIMVGYPAAGKSTIANSICENENYTYISGDVYKTIPKIIKVALEYILQKKSIVFDSTNGSCKKRKQYVELGKKYNYEIKCVHVATSSDISYKRNKTRSDEKQVPKIAYSVYKKYFEEPDNSEGFTLITV